MIVGEPEAAAEHVAVRPRFRRRRWIAVVVGISLLGGCKPAPPVAPLPKATVEVPPATLPMTGAADAASTEPPGTEATAP
ncbi:MAG: hypothetical protein SH850_30410, partial [Planctomycetaceae bacterium]|nr:hypothetical protein [Planctomycetaceae bacterium]